jgi:flavin-dependent dehydrogenase
MLRQIGMGRIIEKSEAVRNFELHMGRQHIDIAMPAGCVVNRALFDAALVEEAQRAGAVFRPETTARVLAVQNEFRHVRAGGDEMRARVVLACDGLRGSSLSMHGWALWEAPRNSRIGLSATVNGSFRRGAIAMYVGTHGYVGAVRQSEERVHVGAAVDPAACKQLGPHGAVAEILGAYDAKFDLQTAPFEGTGALTGKRRAIAEKRILIIGDACGYVEPFTGEGMAWAIAGAIAAVRLLPKDLTRWPPGLAECWEEQHRFHVASRQRWCRVLRQILNRPRVAGACMHLAGALPWVSAMIARRIGA